MRAMSEFYFCCLAQMCLARFSRVCMVFPKTHFLKKYFLALDFTNCAFLNMFCKMRNHKEKQWWASESMKTLNISFPLPPLCSWPPHFEMVRSNELHSSFAKNFQKWVSSSHKQWLVGFAVRVACNNRISKESNKDFQFHPMPPPN